MQIIDAFWEKRNLNMDTTEILIEENDSCDDIENVIGDLKKGYVVVKINPTNINEMNLLQKNGFVYTESIFSVEAKLKDTSLPKVYERFNQNVKYEFANQELTNVVLEEIKSGRIFKTDRIALDPHFSQQVAGVRYYNWSSDELDKNAILNIAYYKDQAVAFGISKMISEKRQDNFLGGVLQAGENKGLGFLAIAANNDSAVKNGAMTVETKVSSNNLPILRLHMQYGYDIKKITYIFVKHYC